MKAINKEKVLSIVLAIFIIQFGIFFIIIETDKTNGNQTIEKNRLERIFNVKFDDNLQPKGTVLNLCCKEWTTIPPELLNFQQIEVLNLDGNKFKDFPDELLQMPNLRTINLNNNEIETIDFNEKNETIINLFLEGNQIQNIENINQLEKLAILKLSGNQIDVLKNDFGQKLRHLDLSKNELKKVDKTINFKSKSLYELNLSYNVDLVEVPNNLLEMPYLKYLNLNHCGLEKWTVKDSLTNRNLSELYLAFNQIKIFKTNSKQLPNLTDLQLSNNQLQRVEVQHLQLSKINLSVNELTEAGLRLDLSSAEMVNLYNNELKSFPKECLIAPNLIKLNLDNNYITDEQGKDIWFRFPKLYFE